MYSKVSNDPLCTQRPLSRQLSGGGEIQSMAILAPIPALTSIIWSLSLFTYMRRAIPSPSLGGHSDLASLYEGAQSTPVPSGCSGSQSLLVIKVVTTHRL